MKIFQSYDHKCTVTFFMNHSVYRFLYIRPWSVCGNALSFN